MTDRLGLANGANPTLICPIQPLPASGCRVTAPQSGSRSATADAGTGVRATFITIASSA